MRHVHDLAANCTAREIHRASAAPSWPASVLLTITELHCTTIGALDWKAADLRAEYDA